MRPFDAERGTAVPAEPEYMSRHHQSVLPAAVRRRPAKPPAGSTRQLLDLQTSVGNKATLRFLAAAQASLTLGATNDPLEADADRVADEVVNALQPRST